MSTHIRCNNLTNPISSRFPTQDDDSHSHALETRMPLEVLVVQNIRTAQCRQDENQRIFQAKVGTVGHRQKKRLDPDLIVVTSKQGLPKLAKLAHIHPPPSFSHHQAITTTIRTGSNCFFLPMPYFF